MWKVLFFAVVVMLFTVSAGAQGVTCNKCENLEPNYSYCSSYMGVIANCTNYCDWVACSCIAGAHGGKCTRDSDGGYTWKTYNNIRFVDPSLPFESAYKIVSVQITPPRAEVRVSAAVWRYVPVL